MTINEEKKFQNLQDKFKMLEFKDISQDKAIRNHYNETQELKSRIQSQEKKIQSQENKIQSQESKIQIQENKIQNQENEIKRLGKEYQGNKNIFITCSYHESQIVGWIRWIHQASVLAAGQRFVGMKKFTSTAAGLSQLDSSSVHGHCRNHVKVRTSDGFIKSKRLYCRTRI